MTCTEAREHGSALLDDTLEAPTRTLLEAHLAACTDCRRELERLAATVAVLRAIQHPRAPAGFVDRVLKAARPAPWYRRLAARVFLPLSVKLPAEAAALVMVAVLGVHLQRHLPAVDGGAPVRVEARAPRASSPFVATLRDAPSKRAERADAAGGRPGASRARSTSERALAELAARAGGREVGRRHESDHVVVELVVPEGAAAEFARQIDRTAGLRVERQEPVPPGVRITVRIAR